MAEYTKKTAANGRVMYRNVTENKLVSAEELENNFPALKEELDLADEGTRIESEGMTGDTSAKTDSNGERDDETKDTPAPEVEEKKEEVEETNPCKKPVPSSEAGMGDFKRVKGKTVDIFDGKTPHTHVRYVSGLMVPLSEASYKNKTEAEIYEQLEKLKLV